MDATTSTTFTIVENAPLVVGSAFKIPKIVLQTNDKIQVQSDNASGLVTVALQLLTDVS
jgi:branched-subunit amino acid transport protein|tara:strand:+ start:195 stop:371 length:177 start_codon:yes stop_codon:yes gene_type:complete